MKKGFLLTSILLGVTLVLSAQKKFQVRGYFSDTAANGDKVTLSYFNGEKKIYTTVVIRDGAFSFDGAVYEPTKAVLTFNSLRPYRKDLGMLVYREMAFYVEGGEVTIRGGSMKDAVVRATGKAQAEYRVLERKLKPFEEDDRSSFMAMLQATVERDTVAEKQHRAVNERLKQQIDSIKIAFMQAHPRSYVSLGILNEKMSAKALAQEKEKLSAWYDALAQPLKASTLGQKLGGQIAMAFKIGPGSMAEDFVLNDTLGHPVRLSSFKGRYVLLDFWASWCIPCRAENPVVKAAHEKFKDRNFTVLGVSLEKPGDRKAWVEAIRKDQLTWTHVATLTKEEHTRVSNLYGIQSIPMNFLIDPQGKIIATYLRGEALLKKLDELL